MSLLLLLHIMFTFGHYNMFHDILSLLLFPPSRPCMFLLVFSHNRQFCQSEPPTGAPRPLLRADVLSPLTSLRSHHCFQIDSQRKESKTSESFDFSRIERHVLRSPCINVREAARNRGRMEMGPAKKSKHITPLSSPFKRLHGSFGRLLETSTDRSNADFR